MAERVWAVVVARVGVSAKSRLASVLTADERQLLALAMLGDVLEQCSSAGLAGTLAVVDAAAAGDLAARNGAIALADPGQGDMNAAVARGIDAAMARGATTAIVLPGDVPRLRSADFEALMRAAGEAPRAVVIGAAHDGQGTNALLLRAPDVIPPGFGPPSVERHRRAGLAAGALTVVVGDLGVAHDVDTPADLAALGSAQLRRHTAAVLATLAPTSASPATNPRSRWWAVRLT
jgi:2-phospho-L-lactate/phosphoenolpyruvate guanylyltransferase